GIAWGESHCSARGDGGPRWPQLCWKIDLTQDHCRPASTTCRSDSMGREASQRGAAPSNCRVWRCSCPRGAPAICSDDGSRKPRAGSLPPTRSESATGADRSGLQPLSPFIEARRSTRRIPLGRRTTEVRARPRAHGSAGTAAIRRPSLGLAPKVVESIFSILAELHREGMSLLIVEQNVQTALNLVRRAYILEGGKIVGEGEGHRLLQDDHVRAAYLGPLARRAPA